MFVDIEIVLPLDKSAGVNSKIKLLKHMFREVTYCSLS